MIAELGISGDRSYKQQWLESIAALTGDSEKPIAIIYFNSGKTALGQILMAYQIGEPRPETLSKNLLKKFAPIPTPLR